MCVTSMAGWWFQPNIIWIIMVNIWILYGIWLMKANNNLVGGFNLPTPLKNDGLKVSWDDFSIPNIWKGIKK